MLQPIVMPGLVLPRQRVCLCNKRIQFFDAIHRGPAGTSMAASPFTDMNRERSRTRMEPSGASMKAS